MQQLPQWALMVTKAAEASDAGRESLELVVIA